MFEKTVLNVLVIIVTGAAGAGGVRVATDEEYAQFPRLFHLDDYNSCMLKKDALYCLGTLQIVPDYSNPTYRLIKEYSEDVKYFNRTYLHRGYCVSERCPISQEQHCTIKNLDNNKSSYCVFNGSQMVSKMSHAQRFERCASKWSQNFRVTLTSLEYCHTQEDAKKEFSVETPHLVFLGVVALVVMLNVVGTVYDVTSSSKKNRLLMSWSLRNSWRLFIGDYAKVDPRLANLLPLEGIRCLLTLSTVYAHVGLIQEMLYLGNPNYVDQWSHHPSMKLIYNGHSTMQAFFVLSSFLLTTSIQKGPQPPSLWILPRLVIKRIVRIAPVFLMTLGFAATWWPLVSHGPQWPPMVEAQSRNCRDRFWLLAFFVNNYVKNDDVICLLPTWYLQIDMQLYVFAILVTVCLARVRRRVLQLRLLGGLFLLSIMVSAQQIYVNKWQPMNIVSGPEIARHMLTTDEAFYSFCAQPLANVGACLVGLFLAHLCLHLRERGFHANPHKRLITWCQLGLLLVPMWTCGAGIAFSDLRSPAAQALYLTLERPVMSGIFAVVLFGIFMDEHTTKENGKLSNEKGILVKMFSWRGLYPLSRLSLAVMLLHWCVNFTIAASRATLFYATALSLVLDFLGSWILSHLAALPVTLLLDLPVQETYAALTRR